MSGQLLPRQLVRQKKAMGLPGGTPITERFEQPRACVQHHSQRQQRQGCQQPQERDSKTPYLLPGQVLPGQFMTCGLG
jgi:hypothetical protein